MGFRKNKTTIVYIDAANVLMSFKNLSIIVDYDRFMNFLSDKYRPKKIIYFTGRFRADAEMYKLLETKGVEIVFKEIYNENSKLKANCGVEISHRITRDLDFNLVDKVVLVSGDGDFVHVLDYAFNSNRRVKSVAPHPSNCSLAIKRRSFLSVTYLSDVIDLINEKPPAST